MARGYAATILRDKLIQSEEFRADYNRGDPAAIDKYNNISLDRAEATEPYHAAVEAAAGRFNAPSPENRRLCPLTCKRRSTTPSGARLISRATALPWRSGMPFLFQTKWFNKPRPARPAATTEDLPMVDVQKASKRPAAEIPDVARDLA